MNPHKITPVHDRYDIPHDMCDILQAVLQPAKKKLPICIESQGLICVKLYYDAQKSNKRFWGRIIDARTAPEEKKLYHFDPLAVADADDIVNFRFAVEQIPLVFELMQHQKNYKMYSNRQIGTLPLYFENWESAYLDFDVAEIATSLKEKINFKNRILREQ
jgi:hypothetical protein